MKSHSTFLAYILLPLFFLILWTSKPANAQSQERPLKNSDIVQMLKSGLSVDVVIRSIQISSTDFELSADDLIVLHAAGISDEILKVMMDRQSIMADTKNVSASTERQSTPTSSPEYALTDVPNDTKLVVVWLQDVSSQSSQVGDKIVLEVYKVLTPAAAQLIPVGSKILGEVMLVQGASRGFFGGTGGTVGFAFRKMVLPTGFEADIRYPKGVPGWYWDFKANKVTDKPKNRIQITNDAKKAADVGIIGGAAAGLAIGTPAITQASGAAGLAIEILPIFKGKESLIPAGQGDILTLNTSEDLCEKYLKPIRNAATIEFAKGNKEQARQLASITDCNVRVPAAIQTH